MTDLTYALDAAHETPVFEIDNDVTADLMLRDVIKNNAERDRLLKLADDMIESKLCFEEVDRYLRQREVRG